MSDVIRALCKRHWKGKNYKNLKWVLSYQNTDDPNYPHEVDIECVVCEWQQSRKDDETIQLFLYWLRVA